MKINHNIVPAFLLESQYRVYRHLLLLLFIGVVTLNFVIYLPGVIWSDKIISWMIYFILMGVSVYSNMYIFVPALLFRNKFLLYIIYVFILAIVFIITVVLVQSLYLGLGEGAERRSLSLGVLNIFSSIITIGLLFAGTSTILLFKNWIGYNKRISELETATVQSEMQLLKSQINPHFLFNMLNNANMLIKKNKQEASRVLFKLEDLLRYQLKDSTKENVMLDSDIHFLNDFLNLEKVRRDNFEYNISKEGNINDVKIPPLLFIPFVENAVKHNPDSDNLSYVNLLFKVWNGRLEFVCQNSKPLHTIHKDRVGGLGLRNIKRRLELLFPEKHKLDITDEENKFTVKLVLSL